MPNGPNTPLTTVIKIKDKTGRVIGEKEVATYAGLLSRAHEEGLTEIQTSLVQIPSEDNGFVCITKADVKTKKGVFTAIGDASPRNVNAKIVPHLIRMAETRAKARALRDAVNIGLVALEELGGDNGALLDEQSGNGAGRWQASEPQSEALMTDAQRRLLFRILAEAGIENDAATTVIIEECGTNSINSITKREASWAIEHLKERYESRDAYHGS